MTWKQIKDASMAVGYVGGWCLKYVQDAFGTDHPYPTARAAWDANYGGGNHAGEPPLGITVPIYLTINGVPAGHVAIRLDDGYVASSTMPGSHGAPYYHKSIQDLIDTYARVYGGMQLLGWSEFVGTQRVVEAVSDNATADQVRQAYLDILERPADDSGLAHYQNYPIGFVRDDLMNSDERRALMALKAAQAQAAADAQAKADAAAKAAADAKAKADAEAAARAEAEKNQPAPEPVPPVDYAKENNAILKKLWDVVKQIAARFGINVN